MLISYIYLIVVVSLLVLYHIIWYNETILKINIIFIKNKNIWNLKEYILIFIIE